MLFRTATALASAALVGSASAQLHRSFYGMAYSPDGAILPNCGAVQADVTADMVNLAQLTPRLRLYGSDCNQSALVLQGIKDAGNVDLSITLGIYVDGNDTVYQRQMDAVVSAIQTYGTEHIAGISVGNEYLLLSYGANGNANDTAGVAARTELLTLIQRTNATIQALKLDKALPIGTSDAGSALTLPLCEGVDFYFANVHPWFGSVDIANAAGWTWNFFQDFDVNVCAPAANNPLVAVAETGWPTSADASPTPLTSNGSIASLENLQTFLDTYVCQANTNQTAYYYFEYKDETWKEIYGGVEPHWGLFYANRTMKDIKIPNCLVTSPTGRSVSESSSSGSSGSGSSGSGGGKASASSLTSVAGSVVAMVLGVAGLASLL